MRDEQGVFVAEGPKIINELLNEPGIIAEEIYAVREWIEAHPVLPSSPGFGKIMEIDQDQLKRISFLTTPNQVTGIFRQPLPERPLLLSGRVSLMTDSIQDPGNMGTIIRCADWFGVSQVICSPQCADAFNPKTVQSSMGSIARVRVIYSDLQQFIGDHPGIPVYAAALSGSSIYEMEGISEGIILVGNESKGIAPDILELVTQRITIPGKGRAESLNAAVAMGIILSHLLK